MVHLCSLWLLPKWHRVRNVHFPEQLTPLKAVGSSRCQIIWVYRCQIRPGEWKHRTFLLEAEWREDDNLSETGRKWFKIMLFLCPSKNIYICSTSFWATLKAGIIARGKHFPWISFPAIWAFFAQPCGDGRLCKPQDAAGLGRPNDSHALTLLRQSHT